MLTDFKSLKIKLFKTCTTTFHTSLVYALIKTHEYVKKKKQTSKDKRNTLKRNAMETKWT